MSISHNQYNNAIRGAHTGVFQINATVAAITWPEPKPLDWWRTPTGINYGYSVRESAGSLNADSRAQAAALSWTLGRLLAVSQTSTYTSITGLTPGYGKLIGSTTSPNTSCSPPNYQPSGPGVQVTTEETLARPGFARRLMGSLNIMH